VSGVRLPTREEPVARADEVSLTPREKDVLQLLIDGHTRGRIALLLEIRPGTVDGYCHSAYVKLGASNAVQAIVRATELGVLDEQKPDEARRTPRIPPDEPVG